MQLICATGNKQKFGIGRHILAQYGITLIQQAFDIDEIQGEDPELIIRDKAMKAYTLLGEPVIVSDDSWSIPALGGFPGAYMKSINHWFTPNDFIDLMWHKTDRSITLHQYLAYCDGVETVVFSSDIPGQIVNEPRGSYGPTFMHIAAMDTDGGLTISEVYDKGGEHDAERLNDKNDSWAQLGAWLQENRS